MADLIFNVAKGKIAYYAGLPATSDALIMVPIETSGIVTDATMKDYDTLSDLLAGASNEQTTMGRKTLASVTVTVDDTSDAVFIDCDDVVWSSASGNAISAVVVCYDGDTGAGTDANIIPLAKFDFVATPGGGDITAQINSSGLLKAA